MTGRARAIVSALLLLALVALPSAASASPWVVDDDELNLNLTYDFQFANKEFLRDGTFQEFPLDGKFSANQLTLESRYGITDRFEVAASIAFKEVSYDADPVILNGKLFEDSPTRVEANESILDFSSSQLGAGDIRLSGVYQFLNYAGIFLLSSDTEIKLPTGYDKPESTFKNDNPVPSNIRDDVSLGAGQTDITEMLQMGAYVPITKTFTRLETGFRFRFGAPGHQMVGGFKLGQFIGEKFILFTALEGAFTVTDGEVIGKSFVARKPQKSSDEIGGAKGDIEPIDLRLDRTFIQVGGGAILRLEEFEIQASYHQIIVGENMPAIKTASAGVVYRMPNLTGAGDKDADGK